MKLTQVKGTGGACESAADNDHSRVLAKSVRSPKRIAEAADRSQRGQSQELAAIQGTTLTPIPIVDTRASRCAGGCRAREATLISRRLRHSQSRVA